MMIKNTKSVLADFIMVFLFSKDNALIVYMVLVTNYINIEERYIKSFKMAYLFKAGDLSMLYL